MATTTNYGWTTPDDTALVKDGAAAIRTLGSSVDTTTAALNPSTTLGDIEYRSSTANTNTRLGIGSSGQVLSVSGGVPAWTTISSGGMTLLSTTSLTSGSSVTISSISQSYKNLSLVISNVTCAGDFYLDVKPNNTTLLAHEIEGRSSTNINYESSTAVRLNFATAQNASAGNGSSAIDFYNYASTTLKKHIRATFFYLTGGSVNGSGHSYGTFTTSAISSISINTSSTFTAGTALLYGVS